MAMLLAGCQTIPKDSGARCNAPISSHQSLYVHAAGFMQCEIMNYLPQVETGFAQHQSGQASGRISAFSGDLRHLPSCIE